MLRFYTDAYPYTDCKMNLVFNTGVSVKEMLFGKVITVYFSLFWYCNVKTRGDLYVDKLQTGADPAFVIRGGPNSGHFLSNLRKLPKGGKFFLTTRSLIVKINWVYVNQFIKTCFL